MKCRVGAKESIPSLVDTLPFNIHVNHRNRPLSIATKGAHNRVASLETRNRPHNLSVFHNLLNDFGPSALLYPIRSSKIQHQASHFPTRRNHGGGLKPSASNDGISTMRSTMEFPDELLNKVDAAVSSDVWPSYSIPLTLIPSPPEEEVA